MERVSGLLTMLYCLIMPRTRRCCTVLCSIEIQVSVMARADLGLPSSAVREGGEDRRRDVWR